MKHFHKEKLYPTYKEVMVQNDVLLYASDIRNPHILKTHDEIEEDKKRKAFFKLGKQK